MLDNNNYTKRQKEDMGTGVEVPSCSIFYRTPTDPTNVILCSETSVREVSIAMKGMVRKLAVPRRAYLSHYF
jgi:hypothetical protein